MANAVRKEWPLLLVVDVLDMLAFDRGAGNMPFQIFLRAGRK
jgi:hypothetical protein